MITQRPPLHPESKRFISEDRLTDILNHRLNEMLKQIKAFQDILRVLDTFAIHVVKLIRKYPEQRTWSVDFVQGVQDQIQKFYLEKHSYRCEFVTAQERLERAERKVTVRLKIEPREHKSKKRLPIQFEISKKRRRHSLSYITNVG